MDQEDSYQVIIKRIAKDTKHAIDAVNLLSIFHQLEQDAKQATSKLDAFAIKLDGAAQLAASKQDALVIKLDGAAKLAALQEELYKLKLAEKDSEIIRSKGAVTTRGIVEYYLKEIFSELRLKGKFNAATVCTSIDEFDVNKSAMMAPSTRLMKKLMMDCEGFKDGDLYRMYGTLSDEIHGGYWSGPSMRYHRKNMLPKYGCFIRGLAQSTFFQVEDVDWIRRW